MKWMGVGTTRDGYEEHLRYVHPYLTGENYPEAEIQWQLTECVKRWRELDVHFHAWARDGFETLLSAIAELAPFHLEAAQFAVNENIFVLRKDLEASRANPQSSPMACGAATLYFSALKSPDA